jgi:hypothetical protein
MWPAMNNIHKYKFLLFLVFSFSNNANCTQKKSRAITPRETMKTRMVGKITSWFLLQASIFQPEGTSLWTNGAV